MGQWLRDEWKEKGVSEAEVANLETALAFLSGFAKGFDVFRRAELILRMRQIFFEDRPALQWLAPATSAKGGAEANNLGSISIACTDDAARKYDLTQAFISVAMRFAGQAIPIEEGWETPGKIGVDTDYYPRLVFGGTRSVN